MRRWSPSTRTECDAGEDADEGADEDEDQDEDAQGAWAFGSRLPAAEYNAPTASIG